MKQVQWTEKQFNLFKKEYDFALHNHQKSFLFHGDEFLVAYAKYLIEYLDGIIKKG